MYRNREVYQDHQRRQLKLHTLCAKENKAREFLA